jgi:hypothetical protein
MAAIAIACVIACSGVAGSRRVAFSARGVASSHRAALFGLDAPVAAAYSKRIKFSAKGSTVVPVDDLEAPVDRPLDAYMTLPPEEWIELDSSVISRLPSTSAASQRYAISLPIQLAAGVCVLASCTVDVDVDARARTLRISGRNATLRMGTAGDARASNVSSLPQPPTAATANATEMAAKIAESLSQAQLEVNFLALARWRPATGVRGRASAFGGGGFAQLLGGLGRRGAADADGNGTLDLSAETTVAISLPTVAARAPGFLLERGGGVVLRLITAALLPEFGKLVAADYRAWSRGLDRTGGQLLRSLGGPGGMSDEPAAREAEIVVDVAPLSLDMSDAREADVGQALPS